MLTDQITLNDGVADRTFTLVSREGMDSIRRETTAGTPSSANSNFVVKHTIDSKNKSKPNRHLVSISYSETDASGNPLTATVHTVITRNKGCTDAMVAKLAEMQSIFIGTPANITSLLICGN